MNRSHNLRVALGNCVPRNQRIISEKQQNVTRFVSDEQ